MRAGDIVVPLTSSIVRVDAAGRIDRFIPEEEHLDPSMEHDELTLRAVTVM